MNFPKAYDPKKVESRIYALWEKSGFFNPDKLPKTHKKPFSIVIPPPNVTGSLHMGHALNGTVQDIIIRQKRMAGYQTLWLPGTDHAGIATQNVVEKELKKQGKTRQDLGREKFLKKVWEWKEKYGSIILDQLKKLGCSCDWSRTRFTMDKDYEKAVLTAFDVWYKKGWIYKGNRVINWCPRCSSSLSDLELEYKEEKGNLWYIKYPLKQNKNKSIVVATTRPETMLGDTAVAVNPKDKRYKDLIGKKVILPLVGKEIPIIADSAVDKNFGTGALKVTPAHSLADFEIGQRHKLAIVKIINEKSKIIAPAPLPYQGLSVSKARQKVVEDLKKQSFLEKTEPYEHSIAKCYRCNAIIESLTSKQWFVKMDKLAELAIKAVKSGDIKFHPKRWEKTYLNWLENVRDWCISRQLWWGHQLPIWRCQIGRISNFQFPISKQIPNSVPSGHLPQGDNDQISKQEKDYFLSLKKPKKCPVCGKCKPKQIPDVLDTWFSSALWPFATLGWPKKTKDLKKFYPTDVLSTDRQIINFWVARMIFSGLNLFGEKPFSDIYIHPTVFTREGKRMSKSLGTGTDPLELIEKYGADATRFGIVWQIMESQDIKFVEDNIIMGKKFCNKVWNAYRFILGQIGKSKIKISKITAKTSADKKILKQLEATIKLINKDLEKYRFGSAARITYDFFWHDFCDVYIEKAKKQEDKEKTNQILSSVLLTSLKMLHPFIPFITEEIYQKLPMKDKKNCLMVETWPINFTS